MKVDGFFNAYFAWFCYNSWQGGDFMPVGVLTNVCAVFIGTFIGGLIKKVLPKHLMEELPKVFGFVL